MVNLIASLRRHATAVALICVAWLCLQGVAAACPTCAEGMNNDVHHASLVRGYFWSIIFMMSMPFLVFAGVCGYFYYEIRRGRARLARGGQYALEPVSANRVSSGA